MKLYIHLDNKAYSRNPVMRKAYEAMVSLKNLAGDIVGEPKRELIKGIAQAHEKMLCEFNIGKGELEILNVLSKKVSVIAKNNMSLRDIGFLIGCKQCISLLKEREI